MSMQELASKVSDVFNSRPSETAPEFTRDQLFEVGDVQSKHFAKIVHSVMMRDFLRLGLLRRFALGKKAEGEGRPITFKFERDKSFSAEYERVFNNNLRHEDGEFLNIIRKNIPKENVIEITRAEFNGQNIALGRQLVTSRNVPVRGTLFGADIYNHMIGDTEISQFIDPTNKLSDVLAGFMGFMFGMELCTDAYRHPEAKVVNAGEMFFFPPAEYLGEYELTDERFERRHTKMIDVAKGNKVWTEWQLEADMISITNINFANISMLRIVE